MAAGGSQGSMKSRQTASKNIRAKASDARFGRSLPAER
jgi:phage terminase large subunit